MSDHSVEACFFGEQAASTLPFPQHPDIPPFITSNITPSSLTTSKTSTLKASSLPSTITFRLNSSSTGAVSASMSQKRERDTSHDKLAITIKRQRNKLAAQKYRQKRVDRIAELEQALEAVKEERDDLELQLAKKDAEVIVLREMLHK
ncbi:hypothetical protein BFJ63_vAg18693 [Fusarium oxysporum f. sp. narcissi]|uniref:BZIP domain-containing protein n=1 Tax=Fusarium oxysporum f. sp. narcissi TaxID=451672 RepID=A0A4Q2UWU5_FUSOX|nr:hypothetical protein BFJ63_vAg18693 [Fusarium oxysporum f. sp. narcissi]